MYLSSMELDLRTDTKNKKNGENWHYWDVANIEALWLAGRPSSFRQLNRGSYSALTTSGWNTEKFNEWVTYSNDLSN